MHTTKGKIPAVCPTELQTYVCVKSNLMKYSLSLLLKEPVSLGVLPRTILCHLQSFSQFPSICSFSVQYQIFPWNLNLLEQKLSNMSKFLFSCFKYRQHVRSTFSREDILPKGLQSGKNQKASDQISKNGSKLARLCGYQWDETVCSLRMLEEKERH